MNFNGMSLAECTDRIEELESMLAGLPWEADSIFLESQLMDLERCHEELIKEQADFWGILIVVALELVALIVLMLTRGSSTTDQNGDAPPPTLSHEAKRGKQ